jgi:hypothetical protein
MTMTGNHYPIPVEIYLGDLVLLARQLDDSLRLAQTQVEQHALSAEAMRRFHKIAHGQRKELEGRLRALGSSEPVALVAIAAPFDLQAAIAHDSSAHAVSRALHRLYAGFHHVCLAYAMLHAAAHRAFDSQTEGNTADLAEAHLRAWMAVAREINQLISEVVIWEWGREGHECQCQCPSCGMGVCLCAPHGANTVDQIWQEVSRPVLADGIGVRLPRTASAAERAGLREGDRIVAINGQEILSEADYGPFQAAVREHRLGEAMRLRVRRDAELLEMPVTRL